MSSCYFMHHVRSPLKLIFLYSNIDRLIWHGIHNREEFYYLYLLYLLHGMSEARARTTGWDSWWNLIALLDYCLMWEEGLRERKSRRRKVIIDTDGIEWTEWFLKQYSLTEFLWGFIEPQAAKLSLVLSITTHCPGPFRLIPRNIPSFCLMRQNLWNYLMTGGCRC